MNTSSKQADPQVVAEWAKGPNEVVRVSLGKYRGQTIVHIRVWYRADDETFRPGRNGISLGSGRACAQNQESVKEGR